jgi:hypothetical protein
MHRLVDPIDLAAQVGKRGRIDHDAGLLGGQPPQIKENVGAPPAPVRT